MSSIVSFLTDFGLSDSYLAEVKAVLLAEQPQLQIVDITHLIPPYDISSGGFHLMRCFYRFPKGSYHLAVVDPGVGSKRKALYAFAGGHHFLGPDNGLLRWAVQAAEKIEQKPASFYEVPIPSDIPPTFHARDVFAPAILHLIGGGAVPWKKLDQMNGHDFPGERELDGIKRGEIVAFDHFGNVVTSIHCTKEKVEGQIGDREDRYKAVDCYSDIEKGKVGLVRGSHGFWELAANQASAKALLQVKIGDEFTVR